MDWRRRSRVGQKTMQATGEAELTRLHAIIGHLERLSTPLIEYA